MLTLLNILASVALLLWGVRAVNKAFVRLLGTRLRASFAKVSGNRWRAFSSGFLITILLQSSTATIFLASSFLRRNFLQISSALAILIGADLGTTLVAKILVFDLSFISPLFLLLGVFGQLTFKIQTRFHTISQIIFAVGLMLLSLGMIREATLPLRESEAISPFLAIIHQDNGLLVLFATVLTWIFQSSLAAVLMFATLTDNGLLDLYAAALCIFGANIGGALVCISATYKDGSRARAITFSNLGMRLIVAILGVLTLPYLSEINFAQDLINSGGHTVIYFHVLFNLFLAVLFLPWVNTLSKIVLKHLPQKEEGNNINRPQYLDDQVLETPAIALACAARETLRLSELVEKMLRQTITVFEQDNAKLASSIRQQDDLIDFLYKEIKLYISKLSQEGMSSGEADRVIEILTFSTNLEHIGDIIDKSLMQLALKKIQRKDSFSDEGFAEIKGFHNLVLENLKLAQAIFMSQDSSLASQLVSGKNAIRNAARDTQVLHFERLRDKLPATVATSSLHLDIIRDYRQINSYATRVAFTILEKQKESKSSEQA